MLRAAQKNFFTFFFLAGGGRVGAPCCAQRRKLFFTFFFWLGREGQGHHAARSAEKFLGIKFSDTKLSTPSFQHQAFTIPHFSSF